MLDFGIAKLADAGARGMARTRADAIMGTPAYMSPEQCRGAGQVDHRADIYALGCILFEMVCGRPPFVGEGLGDLIHAHMTQLPPAPRGLAPELPEALEQLIFRMLAKPEADRPPSMDAVAAELEVIAAAATGAPGSTATLPPQAPGAIGTASRAAAITTFGGSAGQVTGASPAPSPRRRLVYFFGLAASLGMAATVAAALVLRGHLPRPPAEHAAAEQAAAEHAAAEPPPPPLAAPAAPRGLEITVNPPLPASERAGEPPRPTVAPPPRAGEPPLPAVAAPPPAGEPPPRLAGHLDPTSEIAPDRAGTTSVVLERQPRPVVHELGCDPACEVVLDGDVVGKATPGSSYRAEFLEQKGRVRSYLLRPTDNQHRSTSYRAPADRSVKALLRLPCAPRQRAGASARPHVYDPYDSCNER